MSGPLVKNTAGQLEWFRLRRADGSVINTTTGVTVQVSIDGAALTSGAGTLSLVGDRLKYAIAQAETNVAGTHGNLFISVDHAEAARPDEKSLKVLEMATITEIESAVNEVSGGVAQLTGDRVPLQLTFAVGTEGTHSRNIVTLNAWSSGTRTLAYDLSELLDQADTTINAVSSVTVVKDETSITTSNLRKHQEQKIALWDVAAIDSDDAGTYEVTVTVTTVDSNTIVVTGELRVE